MKHKTKLIAAAVVVAVLAGAWFFGGNYNKNGGGGTPSPTADAPPTVTAQITPSAPNTPNTPVSAAPVTSAAVATPETMIPDATPTNAPETAAPEAPISPSAAPDVTAAPTPEMTINPETGKDQYLTDPVPSGRPAPVEPQDVTVGDGSFTVTLSVECATILNNMQLLDANKHELVPPNGVIFPAATVTAYEGESVFNVLQRSMKQAKIHMEFVNTPIYNSAYIEGINNLYEFDVGELSGWMYAVNGWYPNYGCSRYQVKPGDVIEWRYTCDLGKDVGGEWAVGGG